MADYNIISPQFSFVKFGDPPQLNSCCNGPQNFSIPVLEETDLQFQFNLTGVDATTAQTIFDLPAENIQLVLLKGADNSQSTFAANTMKNWTVTDGLMFERYRSEELGVTYIWKNNLKDFKSFIACEECFQLGLKLIFSEDVNDEEFSDEFSPEFLTGSTLGNNVIVGISNSFVRICNDCFTSLIEYSSEEDGNGFYYCNDIGSINRVRLPMYFKKPQINDEQTIYKKSNGTIKLLKSVSAKEYEAVTDFFPEHIHDKLKVAIDSDLVFVATGAYSGGFRKSGAYEIEWDDEELCTAPAKFKALVTPYAVRNNNCKDCSADDQMELTNDVFPDDLAEDETYVINCAANDKVYCSPKTYSIVSINIAYIASATVTPEGVLTITMKSGIATGTAVPLITYRVTCANGQKEDAIVSGDITGIVSSCNNPTDGAVELVYVPVKSVVATFSSVVGAVAYRIRIINTSTGAFTDYAATDLPSTNNFILADGNYDFVFFSDCGSGSYSSGSAPVNITVVDAGGGGGGSYNYYQGTQLGCASCADLGDVLVRTTETLTIGMHYLDTDGQWTLINATSPGTLYDVEVFSATGYSSCPGVCI